MISFEFALLLPPLWLHRKLVVLPLQCKIDRLAGYYSRGKSRRRNGLKQFNLHPSAEAGSKHYQAATAGIAIVCIASWQYTQVARATNIENSISEKKLARKYFEIFHYILQFERDWWHSLDWLDHTRGNKFVETSTGQMENVSNRLAFESTATWKID